MFTKSVPIDDYREIILKTVENNILTIITAETGSGKSTRIPGWFFQQRKRVVVTQPRRIAARALSFYLASETKTEWGKEIGYQTALDERCSKETRLLYVTDGIQMLQEIRASCNYDILLIDEIHEWNLYQEVLIALLKRKLEKAKNCRNQRYLILSATLDAERLSRFFGHAPVISVSGRVYPLEMQERNPLFMLPDAAQYLEEKKNILVFQQGKSEIENFQKELQRILAIEKIPAIVLPLHSELTLEEQNRIFRNYDLPKAVIATNIAQTSLTIDDVDIVLDDGLKKELRVEKNIEGLYSAECSKADCLQRAGRVGRTRKGSYILYSEFPLNKREAFSEPELRRLHLENIVLRMLKWGIDPKNFQFFHYIKPGSLKTAIKKLQLFEAVDLQEKVTPLGAKMADLPLSLRAARMVVESLNYSKNIFLKTLKIIAILETKGITRQLPLSEGFVREKHQSDLLVQLQIWENQKNYRDLINFKKLQAAQTIYQQLRKRIGSEKKAAPAAADDEEILFRIILSGFPEGLYQRDEQGLYIKGSEFRSLEASSVLIRSKPEFVCGLPFDLSLLRENPLTLRREKISIQLLTFCNEVKIGELEKLGVSYYRKRISCSESNGRLTIFRQHFWKDQLFKSEATEPVFLSREEKREIITPVFLWLQSNLKKTDLFPSYLTIQKQFREISKIPALKLKTFDYYWRNFLEHTIINELKLSDLNNFFNGEIFKNLRLFNILPRRITTELQKLKWPETTKLGSRLIKIQYEKELPFLKISFFQLKQLKREELILANGLTAGIIINRQKFFSYEQAVDFYNQTISRELYWRKWANIEKETKIEEIHQLQFPVAFQAGSGKDNYPIFFYIVPKIQNDQLLLIHLFSEKEARNYWQQFLPLWKKIKAEYSHHLFIDNLSKKGWKIRK